MAEAEVTLNGVSLKLSVDGETLTVSTNESGEIVEKGRIFIGELAPVVNEKNYLISEGK